MVTANRRPLWGNTLAEDLDLNTHGAKLMEDLLQQDYWIELVGGASSWAVVLSGSGSIVGRARELGLSSGATANSYANVYTNNGLSNSVGKNSGVTNWSKRVALEAQFWVRGTANGIARVNFGYAGDLPAKKAIGILLRNLALKGEVHNGTSLTEVDLGTTLTTYYTCRVAAISDGKGLVVWYVDTGGGYIQKGSTAAGPTGDGGGNEDWLGLRVENGADAAVQQLSISGLKLYIQQ